VGNALGLVGVGGGIATTLGALHADPGTLAQIVASLGLGGGIGYGIARRMAITELPQARGSGGLGERRGLLGGCFEEGAPPPAAHPHPSRTPQTSL